MANCGSELRAHLLVAKDRNAKVHGSTTLLEGLGLRAYLTGATRPYPSSKRTMSSSPTYSPLCTSMSTRGSMPGFSRRCRVPALM